MSVYYSLPLIILNLGGEMFYVLDQRLEAQNVPIAKGRKILDEIAATLFNEIFIDKIFKPQPLYHKQELYLLFRKIAHASIIKLNDDSMGKLYDLMIMVFKYQLYSARQPREILLITLNHLNSVREMVTSPDVFKQLDSVYYLFMERYYSMYDAELQRIRYDLLNYLQDVRIKVSICLRLGLQTDDGTFVNPSEGTLPYGSAIPGVIKYLNKDGTVGDINVFPPGDEYTVEREKPCYELKCTKGTLLGTSIYKEKLFNSFPQDLSDCTLESQMVQASKMSDYHCEVKTLMNQLLGSGMNNVEDDNDETILLDLFAHESKERNRNDSEGGSSAVKTITLCGTSNGKRNSALEVAATELFDNSEHSDEGGDNLLYLLENTE